MESRGETPPSATGGGRLAVLAILLVGLAAASVAWIVNYQRSRKTIEFFGAEGAALVRTAPRVELLRAAPDAAVDLSHAPGLLNARSALLSDDRFDWKATPRLDSPLFTVRFSDAQRSIDVTFDFENRTLQASSTGKVAVLQSKMSEGWRQYLAKQLEPQAGQLPAEGGAPAGTHEPR